MVLLCKFEQNWTKMVTPDTFCVKYPNFQIFRIFLKEILPKSQTSKCNNF